MIAAIIKSAVHPPETGTGSLHPGRARHTPACGTDGGQRMARPAWACLCGENALNMSGRAVVQNVREAAGGAWRRVKADKVASSFFKTSGGVARNLSSQPEFAGAVIPLTISGYLFPQVLVFSPVEAVSRRFSPKMAPISRPEVLVFPPVPNFPACFCIFYFLRLEFRRLRNRPYDRLAATRLNPLNPLKPG
jgi:hypothetical protein